MKILPFSKRKYKSLMLQLFTQLLAIVLFMVSFILIINSTFIEAMFYLRHQTLMSYAVSDINEIQEEGASFYDEIKKIESQDTNYIEIFSGKTGMLLYCSVINDVRDHNITEFEKNPDVFMQFARPRVVSVVRTLDTKGDGVFFIGRDEMNDMEYLIHRATLDSGHIVNIYTQMNIIQSNASYTSDILRIVICVVGIALMIAFFIYAWLFTRPLIEMNDVTKHMAKMDFSKKCITRSTNELGQLADSINSMSDSLAEALGDLQEKNRQLEIDIEHEHKMEKSRKAFVSNVSHELKTPIAIIQGYAEGLKLGISDNPQDNEEYLDVIIEESKKMNDLVLDLLELSYYESGSYKLNEEIFSLNHLIDDYVSAQKIRLAEEGISLEVSLPDNMTVFADDSKIGMVLNNYFSNAMSHCEGEKKIVISAEKKEDVYRISVFNTGKNISEENFEEMWHSFHRGDASRRRGEGRYGIGLSIVAAIQKMHSMEYGCINKPDGVEFWFDVKKCVKNLSM